jgi:hypothetical protein
MNGLMIGIINASAAAPIRPQLVPLEISHLCFAGGQANQDRWNRVERVVEGADHGEKDDPDRRLIDQKNHRRKHDRRDERRADAWDEAHDRADRDRHEKGDPICRRSQHRQCFEERVQVQTPTARRARA